MQNECILLSLLRKMNHHWKMNRLDCTLHAAWWGYFLFKQTTTHADNDELNLGYESVWRYIHTLPSLPYGLITQPHEIHVFHRLEDWCGPICWRKQDKLILSSQKVCIRVYFPVLFLCTQYIRTMHRPDKYSDLEKLLLPKKTHDVKTWFKSKNQATIVSTTISRTATKYFWNIENGFIVGINVCYSIGTCHFFGTQPILISYAVITFTEQKRHFLTVLLTFVSFCKKTWKIWRRSLRTQGS